MKYLSVPKNPEITKIPLQDEAEQFLLNPLKLKFVSRRRSKKRKLKFQQFQKFLKFLKFLKLLQGSKKLKISKTHLITNHVYKKGHNRNNLQYLFVAIELINSPATYLSQKDLKIGHIRPSQFMDFSPWKNDTWKVVNFRSRWWGSSLPGLRTLDPSRYNSIFLTQDTGYPNGYL